MFHTIDTVVTLQIKIALAVHFDPPKLLALSCFVFLFPKPQYAFIECIYRGNVAGRCGIKRRMNLFIRRQPANCMCILHRVDGLMEPGHLRSCLCICFFKRRKWLGTLDGKRSRRNVIVAPNPFCPNQSITRSPEKYLYQVVCGFARNNVLVDPSSVSSPYITILLTFSIIRRTSSRPEAIQPVGFSCNLCRCRYARGRIRFTSLTITICPPFDTPGFPMIQPTKPLPASPNPPCPQVVSSPH